MKKQPWVLALATTLPILVSLACTSEYEAGKLQATENALAVQGTATALYATIEALMLTGTPKPEPTLTPTPDPDCIWTTDYFGVEICVEADKFSDSLQSEGNLTTESDSGNGWLWYFDSTGNRLGQVAEGLHFEYKLDESGEDYIVQLKGWMPDSDLDLTTLSTLCTSHNWGHRGEAGLCHGHFWDSGGTVLATIPTNFSFQDAGEISEQYIRNQYGIRIRAKGREVVIKELVRIHKGNANP